MLSRFIRLHVFLIFFQFIVACDLNSESDVLFRSDDLCFAVRYYDLCGRLGIKGRKGERV